MDKLKIDMKTAARLSGTLSMVWTGVWLILCMIFKDEQLDMINSVHPWKLWAGVLVLMVLVHLAVKKLKPDFVFKGTSSDRLILQAQIMAAVMMTAILWSDLVEVPFPWTMELAVLIAFELLLVMNDNARGMGNKGSNALVIGTGACLLGLTWIVNKYIDIIGQAIVFAGLKVRAGITVVLAGVSKVVIWLSSHLHIRTAVYPESVYETEVKAEEAVIEVSAGEKSYTFMKYLVFGFIGLIIIAALAALISILIEKLKALWQRRSSGQSLIVRHETKKRNPLSNFISFVKERLHRLNSIRILMKHKDSVGYAIYELERKYKTSRSLRRKSGETPDEFIDRIIEYILSKDEKKPTAFDLNEEISQSDEKNDLMRLRRIAEMATRAAYDRNCSWLEPVEMTVPDKGKCLR